MLSEALQRNAKHEARLSNISDLFQLQHRSKISPRFFASLRMTKRDGFYEHSSFGVVLLRRKTRRHRSSRAQYSLRYSATSRQRANCQIGGITWHEAFPAASILALADGDGALRVHPAVLREH